MHVFYVNAHVFLCERISNKCLQTNCNCFDALQEVPKDILDKIRNKFAAAKETILDCSKPWPPWALVHLLDIEDSDSPVPAEIMLYQALQRPNRVGGLILPHNDEIQVNVLHVCRGF